MKGTVQAIIRGDDGTARPFSTIAVDDVDAAVTELQGMASTAAPEIPAPPADAAPAAPAPTPPAPDAPPATDVDVTPAPAPIADQTAPESPAAAAPDAGGAPAGGPWPFTLADRVAALETRVTALEPPKTEGAPN